MKAFRFALLSTLSMAVVAVAGSADASTQFRCENFAGVEEYRSNVDIAAKTADFFDNDTTSEMDLMRINNIGEGSSVQRFDFEGPDASSEFGRVRLEFTLQTLEAKLILVDGNENQEIIGSVTCESQN